MVYKIITNIATDQNHSTRTLFNKKQHPKHYMNSDNDHTRVQDLENLSKKELIQRVQKLEFELKGEEHLTKVDIIQRLRQMEELGLEDEDLMNVEQEYNIGLKKAV